MQLISQNNLLSNISNITIPNVIDRDPVTGQGVAFDLFSRLMADGIIVISSPIDQFVAATVTGSLLYLENRKQKGEDIDISLYINSPGGSVTDGLAIYDTMQTITSDVTTICFGQASSMGAILLVGGTQGKRIALKNSNIMIHQPMGGYTGKADEIRVQATQITKTEKQLYGIIAEHTSKNIEQVYEDCRMDHFMTPTQALDYGIIDIIY